MLRHYVHCLGVCILWMAMLAARAEAQSVELASAEMGTSGRLGGTAVTTTQWVAWRFSTEVPLDVHHLGAHILSIPEELGDIFAAIVRLESVNSLPIGAPFNDDEVLGVATFRPNFPSDEFFTPLDATLLPGSYALVFGTGLYGATGFASLPNGPDQPDIPPTDLSSFIFWSVPRPGAPQEWRENLASHMRIVIQADVIHLPGDYNFNGAVEPDDYDVWSSDFGMTGEQNADGNNDQSVDAADYTIWRDNLGSSIAKIAGSNLAVPEPSNVALFLVGITLISIHAPTTNRRNVE